MDTYTVSSDFPIPSNHSRSGIPEKLRSLNVGQSFAIDRLPDTLAPCDPDNLCNRVGGWIAAERKRSGKKFRQRTQIENGTTVVRIWRVE